MKKNAIVIGAGFAGISAATHLAHRGFNVKVLDKNQMAGGRAQRFAQDGFTFDMGPSWYWMPDVFERYFNNFGKSTSDYYDLIRLDPSYRIYFGENDVMDVPASMEELLLLFEKYEKGSGSKLQQFLHQAAYKYDVGINDLVYKPGRSLKEFTSPKLLIDVIRMDVFMSFHKHIRKYFKHPKLLQLLEFPVLFLGAIPQNTPALYSLMNYADMSLGTWYPMGGMFSVVDGMKKLAESLGVQFHFSENVEKIVTKGDLANKVITQNNEYEADVIIAGADYHHVETKLLDIKQRNYTDKYWEKRVMAPSCLIFYLGVSKELKNVLHHTLFFDEDFGPHAQEIYTNPQWPSKPLFYSSVPSKTDPHVAPKGMENLFLLVPIAPGIEDNDEIREKYYQLIMKRFEKLTGQSIQEQVIFKRSYAIKDFKSDYNSFKGNAYGLANTLTQTAILKPSLKNKHIRNLYYTGQLTVPGPGVPPSLISGNVVANEIIKDYKIDKNLIYN
jgi:phytoene desaturase